MFSVHYGVASLDKLYAGYDVGYHQPEAKDVVQEAHAADQLSVYQPVVLYHLFGHLRTIPTKQITVVFDSQIGQLSRHFSSVIISHRKIRY